MAKKDITDLLERSVLLEERVGLTFEGLLVLFDNTGYRAEPRIDLLGEVVARDGDRFKADAMVQFVFLNSNDQVIGVINRPISEGDAGYEAFQDSAELEGVPVKIKLMIASR